MTIDAKLLQAHRAEIVPLLSAHGLGDVRLSHAPCTRLLVTPDIHVDLGDLIEAAEAVSALMGFAVQVISVIPDLGRKRNMSSEAL